MTHTITKAAVLGAGSLRAGAAVLAGLCSADWYPGGEIALADQHEESLDLHERLARVLIGYQELQIAAISYSNARLAMDGADTIVLCFGLGELSEQMRNWRADNSESNAAFARCVLLHPYFDRLNEWLHQVKPNIVVNLVTPVALTSRLLAYDAVHLDWPETLPNEDRVGKAHQILRWVHGDEPAFEPLKLANTTFVDALKGATRPERHFDPSVLAKWLTVLESSGGRP